MDTLEAIGLGLLAGAIGTVALTLVVWGGDVLLYRALGIAKMPWSWSGPELAGDLWGKGVYVVATSAAFVALEGAL